MDGRRRGLFVRPNQETEDLHGSWVPMGLATGGLQRTRHIHSTMDTWDAGVEIDGGMRDGA